MYFTAKAIQNYVKTFEKFKYIILSRKRCTIKRLLQVIDIFPIELLDSPVAVMV
jgi:hypothetical protein